MSLTKPREFWITFKPYEKDPLGPCTNVLKYVATLKHEYGLHVREVVPIDWDKVWEKYWEWHGSMKNENMYVDKIKELVEKQLKGEE